MRQRDAALAAAAAHARASLGYTSVWTEGSFPAEGELTVVLLRGTSFGQPAVQFAVVVAVDGLVVQDDMTAEEYRRLDA